MNEKLPYEHRLADKLNQLPVPDEDSSWNRMKTLLDRELPPTGGGGGDDGRMPGGRWWGIGVSIGVILLTSWLAYHEGWLGNGHKDAAVAESKKATQDENHKADTVAGYDRAGTGESQRDASQKNATDLSNQPKNEKNLLETNQNDNNESGSANPNVKAKETGAAPNPANTLSNNENAGSGKSAVANAKNDVNKTGAGNSKAKKGKGTFPVAGGLAVSGAGNKNSVNGSGKRGNNAGNHAGSTDNKYRGKNNLAASKSGKGNKNSNSKTKHTRPGLQTITEENSEDDVMKGLAYEESFGLLASHQSNRKRLRVRAESIADMPEDIPENEKQKKTKSPEDMGFVFGLAFYQNFAISSNLSFNYNSDAKKNIMLDYLPSLYGQYHFNNKMYVQAELQFNMPQPTPKLLMYSGYREQMVAGGIPYDVHRNTYLRKLYYFNIPMSFHYSPAKNFWLGGGLQFSSLNSGLVSVEDTYTPTAGGGSPYTKSFVSKIKNDSLTDRLSKTEFRLMLDVNYNWRWLTAGLRLNQALKDYVNLNYYSAPPARDKNESLQLYLRFNLWDGRHRMKAAKEANPQNP